VRFPAPATFLASPQKISNGQLMTTNLPAHFHQDAFFPKNRNECGDGVDIAGACATESFACNGLLLVWVWEQRCSFFSPDHYFTFMIAMTMALQSRWFTLICGKTKQLTRIPALKLKDLILTVTPGGSISSSVKRLLEPSTWRSTFRTSRPNLS